MPLALRLSDGLGHAGAEAQNCEQGKFFLTSRHGADHAATTVGGERIRLGLSAPGDCAERDGDIPLLARRDGVGVAWLFLNSSVRH